MKKSEKIPPIFSYLLQTYAPRKINKAKDQITTTLHKSIVQIYVNKTI